MLYTFSLRQGFCIICVTTACVMLPTFGVEITDCKLLKLLNLQYYDINLLQQVGNCDKI